MRPRPISTPTDPADLVDLDPAGLDRTGPDRTGSGSDLGGPTAFPVDDVIAWYGATARDLPWRRPERTPWGVLVSEVMLQQTPVARVEPAWHAWLERWPTPAALAAEPPGEAIRMWGRLGYPRRALRLHAAAVAIVERHDGEVPADVGALLALPGIGDYTARAVASFAFGQRHPVVDTNVRRVLTRVVRGQADPGPASPARDLLLAEAVVPEPAAVAAVFAVAVMELGALLCTARAPACDVCPITAGCAWWAAGRPEHDGPRRTTQRFEGTDRQVRGRLMAVVRAATGAVAAAELDAIGGDDVQRARALAGLVADGLLVAAGDGTYRLPLTGRPGRRPAARAAPDFANLGGAGPPTFAKSGSGS